MDPTKCLEYRLKPAYLTPSASPVIFHFFRCTLPPSPVAQPAILSWNSRISQETIAADSICLPIQKTLRLRDSHESSGVFKQNRNPYGSKFILFMRILIQFQCIALKLDELKSGKDVLVCQQDTWLYAYPILFPQSITVQSNIYTCVPSDSLVLLIATGVFVLGHYSPNPTHNIIQSLCPT